LTLLDWPEIIY